MHITFNVQLAWGFRDTWASLVAQMVKNPPVMWETWVQSLDLGDPLEEGMATPSSILAWRIPMDQGAWKATQSVGSQRVGYAYISRRIKKRGKVL